MKNKQLVIHLGLPKTATTTLQSQLFTLLPGYIGKAGKGPTKSDSYKKFRNVYSRFFRAARWERVATSWLKNLDWTESNTLMISDEDLVKWPSPLGPSFTFWPVHDSDKTDEPRSGSFPILSLLNFFKRFLDAEGITLKLILTLRNQTDFLGSLAAEAGAKHDGAVVQVALRKDPFIDYFNFVCDLESKVGKDNLLVLLFEDGVPENWRRILAFIGEERNSLFNAASGITDKNKRKIDEGQWIVRQSPVLFNPRVHKFLRSVVGKRLIMWIVPLRKLRAILFRTPSHSSQRLIQVTDRDRALIREHCNLQNEKLGELLGRNLFELGY